MKNKKGLFVVFEGIDGSGKNTQLINLMRHIDKLDKYQDVIKTHEPWKAEEIKKKLEEDKDAYSDGVKMANLYIEDRIAHSEEIKSRLDEGYFILCDRYKMSTCAYQWVQGVSLYKLFKMHDNKNIILPDLTIFVDTPVETALSRISNRGAEKEKFEDWRFQRDLVSYYQSLISRGDCKSLFGEVVSVNGRSFIDEVSEKVRNIFDIYYSNWKEKNNNIKSPYF